MERYRRILFGSIGLMASLTGCAGFGARPTVPGSDARPTNLVTRSSAVRERVAVRDDATQGGSAPSRGSTDRSVAQITLPDDRRPFVSDRVARYFPRFQRPPATLGRDTVDAQVPEDLWAEAARAGAKRYVSDRGKDVEIATVGREEPSPVASETSVLPVALQIESGVGGGRPRVAVVPGPMEGRPQAPPIRSPDPDLEGRPRALPAAPEWAVPAAMTPAVERPKFEPNVITTSAKAGDLLEVARAVTYDEPEMVAERAAAYEPDLTKVGMPQAPGPRRPLSSGAPPAPVPSPDLPTPAPLTRPEVPQLPSAPVEPISEPIVTPPPPQAPVAEPAPVETPEPEMPKPEPPSPGDEPKAVTEPEKEEAPEQPEPPAVPEDSRAQVPSRQAPEWTLPPGSPSAQAPSPGTKSTPQAGPVSPMITYLAPNAPSKARPPALAPSKVQPVASVPVALAPSKVPPVKVVAVPSIPPIPSKTLPSPQSPAKVAPVVVVNAPRQGLKGFLAKMFGKHDGPVVASTAPFSAFPTTRAPAASPSGTTLASARTEEFVPGWGPRPIPSRYAKVSPLGEASTPDALFPVAYYQAQNQPDLAVADVARPQPQPGAPARLATRTPPPPHPQPELVLTATATAPAPLSAPVRAVAAAPVAAPVTAPVMTPAPVMATASSPIEPKSYWWDKPVQAPPKPSFIGRLMARMPWNGNSAEAGCSCDCHQRHAHDRAPAPPPVPEEALVRQPVPSPSIGPKPGDLPEGRDLLQRVSADGFHKASER